MGDVDEPDNIAQLRGLRDERLNILTRREAHRRNAHDIPGAREDWVFVPHHSAICSIPTTLTWNLENKEVSSAKTSVDRNPRSPIFSG